MKTKKELKNNVYLNFLKENKNKILLIILGILVYTIIHRLLQYFIANHLMYTAEICWTCFPISVEYLMNLDAISKSNYFLITIAPYLLSIILLIVLYSLYLSSKSINLVFISIIPFFDVIVNIIMIPFCYIAKQNNDFLNLFIAGFSWEIILIILTPIFLFYLIVLNYKRDNLKNKKML